jgi:hypothetical protein
MLTFIKHLPRNQVKKAVFHQVDETSNVIDYCLIFELHEDSILAY